MKSIFILISFLLLTIYSFGQISPSLKTGFGYSYVLDEDVSISPDYHTITGFPTFSVEKPFPVEIRQKKRLSINPGFAYYFFKQDEVKGDTIEGKDFKFNHHSIDGYVKVLFQAKLQRNREAFVYAGGIAGIHLITKTKGNKITYGLNQETPIVEVTVNENGKEFFELFYYGAVAGFQPHAKKTNFIKPSFEISFYPGFVSKPKPSNTPQKTYRDINTIQFTILLGFRIK